MTENKNILQVGEKVGAYRVLGFLGSGAMGAVFKVHHELLSQDYALKILTCQDSELWQRFQNEAQAIARLNHPNLIAVYNFGLLQGLPYYVMDLLDGFDLAQKIKERPLSPHEALPVFIEVCAGMGYAHSKGVVHRDVKPSNILLLKPAAGVKVRAKVLDFGIAKLLDSSQGQDLTKTGQVFGTPYYMSPEQCQGKAVDNRSDIYSLGCTLFESLTGTVPAAGANALETMLRHVGGDVLKLNYDSRQKFPADLELVVARALALEPEHRYQTMEHLARDLNAILAGRSISGRPEKPDAALSARTSVPVDLGGQGQDKKRGKGSGIQIVAGRKIVLPIVAALTLAFGLIYLFSNKDAGPTAGRTTASGPTDKGPSGIGAGASSGGRTNSGFNADKSANDPASTSDLAGRQIASASLRLRTPFSRRVTEFGKSLRIFDFPDDTCIGTIGSVDRAGEAPYPARGNVYFPADQLLQFCPAPVVAQVYKYNCLTRFRSGDVFSLKIADGPNSEKLLQLGSEIPGVKELNLFGVSSLSPGAAVFLHKMVGLEVLEASYCRLPGRVLAQLGCSQLRKVYLAGAREPGKFLAKLVSCPHLTNLGLKGTVLNSSDIALVASCTGLTALDLDRTTVTEADLLVLSRLSHLSELCLRRTHLSAAAAPVLKRFKGLRNIYISNETADVPLYQALKKTLAGVAVHADSE